VSASLPGAGSGGREAWSLSWERAYPGAREARCAAGKRSSQAVAEFGPNRGELGCSLVAALAGIFVDGEECPLSGRALEGMRAARVELEPGPGDEVLDGARDEDVARVRRAHHPRADVDGDAANVVADELALAGVQARSGLDAELEKVVTDRTRAADCSRGAVECG
jgi:hypothetical protein